MQAGVKGAFKPFEHQESHPAFEILGKAFSKVVPGANFSSPVFQSAFSHAIEGGSDPVMAVRYAKFLSSAHNRMKKKIESVFSGADPTSDLSGVEARKNLLRDAVENDWMGQEVDHTFHDHAMQAHEMAPEQSFAEGGEVSDPFAAQESSPPEQPDLARAISDSYPEQAQLLTMAKGRVFAYLNQHRPLPKVSLPYDTETRQPKKERAYDEALTMAVDPLSILGKVRNGSLRKEHVTQMQTMYPEVYDMLSRGLTEKLVDSSMKGERPSYSVRRALGTFLGSPVDSTTTPLMAMKAQQALAPPQDNQPAPPPKPKRGTSSLSKVAQDYQTPTQASAAEKTRARQ
jgi:hypothetical protein